MVCVFFFFQAEDGIRDLTVTGVQTCALPIWRVNRVSACAQTDVPRPHAKQSTEMGRKTMARMQVMAKTLWSGTDTLRLRPEPRHAPSDRKSTRLNSSHSQISYAVFCLKKKKKNT